MVTQSIAVGAGILTVIIRNLPDCLFPLAEILGLIPEGVLTSFSWQLMFFPLEYLTYLPAMLVGPFSGSILLVLVGVLKLYLQELR